MSSVEKILSEICAQNRDILGTIVVTERCVYNGLPSTACNVDIESVVNYTSNMFEISRALDRAVTPFNQLFLEFAGLSLYALLINDTIIIVAAHSVERAAFEDIQDTVRDYLKPLQEALFAVEGEDRPYLVAPVETLHPVPGTAA